MAKKSKTYATFKDLKWQDHPDGGKMAIINFSNDFGASIISGENFYSSEEFPFEIAVLKFGNICFNSGITEDVIGYCNEETVTNILKDIQDLEQAVEDEEEQITEEVKVNPEIDEAALPTDDVGPYYKGK